MTFAALDFETANTRHASICSVGVVVFDNGKVADSYYSLVRPPKGDGWFYDRFIAVHGITHETVRNAPEFPAIARELFARVAAADVVVAHNAPFDMSKLCATARHFGIEVPPFDYLCTMALARRVWPKPLLPNHDLASVAAHIGCRFKHHHALADAEACGRIMVAMMAQKGVAGPRPLAEAVGLRLARMA